jgi:plastocyanin
MERREFVEKLGVGSVVALVTGGAIVAAASATGAGKPAPASAHAHQDPVKGPLASATVVFGAWRTDLALDRYPNVSPGAANAHVVTPHQATIKAGGSVAFVISGLHQILVYGPDVSPDSINAQIIRPSTGTPSGAPLINDPANRVYGGLDPSTQPRERTEVVHFHAEGKYLVICGVQPHFVNDQMFGWVRVLPANVEG